MDVFIVFITILLLLVAAYAMVCSLLASVDEANAIFHLFLVGILLSVMGIVSVSALLSLKPEPPSYSEEWEIKCRSIDGEFSQNLNACYKNGVKVNFEE